jgi:nucleoside-diphosphate-sugar epimerase
MRILIIGGTGNISTAVTRYLAAKGYEVILYNIRDRDIPFLGNVRTITGDRTLLSAFEKDMGMLDGLDCVIDMICYRPEEAESVVRAFTGRVNHLIFCSTVDVFTKPAHTYPVREDAERKPNPVFSYAFQKAQCEFVLEKAAARGDFKLTILRPVATYNDTWCPLSLIGPGPAFMKRIRQGQPIIIMGDGTSFWTSCHRDDTARAFAGAACNPIAYGKSYNLSGDETMTWEAYYQTVARVMGAPPLSLLRIPAGVLARMAPKSAEWCELNFQYNNIFDNSAAKKDLEFAYTVTWEEGVRRMVAYNDEKGWIDAAEPFPIYEKIVESWQRFENEVVHSMAGLDR